MKYVPGMVLETVPGFFLCARAHEENSCAAACARRGGQGKSAPARLSRPVQGNMPPKRRTGRVAGREKNVPCPIEQARAEEGFRGKQMMEWNLLFFFNSVLLGLGLAMDAFSVSLANGLNEPDMGCRKMCGVAGVFAFFQAVMPIIGWICVHTIVQYFNAFRKLIPWIALVLLLFIGGKMLIDGMKNNGGETEKPKTDLTSLLLQGIATSIDALSVGFAIVAYGFVMAVVCALIIAAVTFAVCMGGLMIGKKFGTKFSNRATILGGIILIVIGFEIFINGIV